MDDYGIQVAYNAKEKGSQMTDAPLETFDIDNVLERIGEAVDPYPKAALFELAEDGFTTPFQQLVACILSIRTRDETMYPMARAFFKQASTPRAVSNLTPSQIDEMIEGSAFHERKAGQIHDIARAIVENHDGRLPCDRELLLTFHGVGPKCANLVMSIACDEPHIAVDVHVHRVTNRWGYVSTDYPEQTMRALRRKLPKAHWVDINRLLVPFGKHICVGRRPYCSSCPVRNVCQQVGVDQPR